MVVLIVVSRARLLVTAWWLLAVSSEGKGVGSEGDAV
jgi:hypothetical protein